MNHLRVVLQVLKQNQLFAKHRKYEFWLRSVECFGHIICSDGVEVYTRKMETLENWSSPLTQTDIKRLSCLAWCYRRFVSGFASIASPLTMFTQNSKKFEWSEAFMRSFQILKDRLTFASVLTIPKST